MISPKSITDHVLELVKGERQRQREKWGPQNHPDGKWMLILMEEIGEAAEASLHENENGLMDELIQVAAVAVAWLERAVETVEDTNCWYCRGTGMGGYPEETCGNCKGKGYVE